MENKKFYKVIRAFKHSVDLMPQFASYFVTFEDRTDGLFCSYRVIAENGIKAIDAAIINFKHDYHHGDVDVVGLERCK